MEIKNSTIINGDRNVVGKESGKNVIVKGDDNIVTTNGGQVATGLLNFQFNDFDLVKWFKSLFDKPKRSVVPLAPGVNIKSVDTSKGFIVVTLSTGEVVCRKAKMVHANSEYVIFE